MPQFELNADRYGAHPFYDLDDFTKGYIEAMFFTNGDIGDERENLLNELGVEKITREAIADIKAKCESFQTDAVIAAILKQAYALDDYDESAAGRDFWFTCQGHGVGYWGRNQLKAEGLGALLTEAAQDHGEAYCKVARGWIYHC